MSEHLSPLDATFLELEEADDSAHMHIGAALVFEPLPSGGAPSVEDVRRHLEERLVSLPRYSQRLSEQRTGGLNWPCWLEDDEFSIERHVRRAALPAPGGQRELMDWLGDYWSHRLDRRRPLWETVVLEGLEGGCWALVTKTHHCMVDGVGSVDAGYVLLDDSPDPNAHHPAPAPRHPAGHDHGLAWRIPAALAGAVRTGADVALHPSRMLEVLEASRGLVELLVRDELVAAPATSLNVPIGKHRRFLTVSFPLAELKTIKTALGGTVNDVVLAVVSGGLRRMLIERGEQPPEQGLRAMVPVNIRAAGDQLALGNRITSLFVHLPVAESTDRGRFAAALAEAEKLKSGSQAAGGHALIEVAGRMPPAIHSGVARSLFASRLFNVTVTNVPGPQIPLYAMGCRMLEVHGLVPLAAEHCVGVAVLSYAGRVSFGLIADRDTVPDLDVLAEGIRASFAELADAAGRRASGRDWDPEHQPAAGRVR